MCLKRSYSTQHSPPPQISKCSPLPQSMGTALESLRATELRPARLCPAHDRITFSDSSFQGILVAQQQTRSSPAAAQQ